MAHRRAVAKGGRRDIFLGTRECQGYVEPCAFGEGKGAYDEIDEMAFGPMFHGYDYPNETGKPELWKRLWNAKMEYGFILFPPPADCPETMRKFVRPMEPTPFTAKRNFSQTDNDASLRTLLEEQEP